MIVKKILNDVRVMKRTGESVTLADFKASNENENDVAWLISYSCDTQFNYLILLEFADIKDEELQDFYDYLLNRHETLMVTRTANDKGVYALIYVKQHMKFLYMQNTYTETLCDKYKENMIGHKHIDNRVFYSNNQKQIWKKEDLHVIPFDWDVNTDEEEADATAVIYFCMKKAEERSTRYFDYIEATDMIYRCASAEKYGVRGAYDFCQNMLIGNGSNSYYTHRLNEFDDAWRYAIDTKVSEILYNCCDKWYWFQLAGYEKKKAETHDKGKCTTFKYKIEKDEQGNITNFVVKKVEKKDEEQDERLRCANTGFAYIERDGKPFEL